MVTRREVLGGAAMSVLGTALLRAAGTKEVMAGKDRDLCRYVDVFIGTGGHGHTFPGATVPFGMVQLSPDTDAGRWDACCGYQHDDRSIIGSSHSHLSGTGVGDMLDVLIAPRVGPVRLAPGTLEHPETGY